MNTENMINSIYNPRRKARDSPFFPKIARQDSPEPTSKVFARAASRKYNQQNIFKLEEDKRERLKLHLADERGREGAGRECEELEGRIAELLKRHHEELREIEQNEKQVASKIQNSKKEHYQIKLNLWELKNELMDLNAQLLDEEAELQRLEALFPPEELAYGEEYLEEENQEALFQAEGGGQLVVSNLEDAQSNIEHE